MVVTQLVEVGEETTGRARLKVVGVGGCGCNAVNRMIKANLTGVEFVAVNTDMQSLNTNLAETKIQIGPRATRGLGAGGNVEIGEQAAEESLKEIEENLSGCHMVFIAAGMGGGTGTGATPIVAKAAADSGAITVGVVTRPFEFEGSIRLDQAEHGIAALRKVVDTLIVIPNERLRTLADDDSGFEDMLDMSNSVLLNAVEGISSLITTPGIINRDFQDVKTVITQGGGAMIGTGKATGSSRASEAARDAISGPLLDGISIEGAKALLVNIQTSASTFRFKEFEEAMEIITRAAGPQANVFMGTSLNEQLGDELMITVVATGFGSPVEMEPEEMVLKTVERTPSISFTPPVKEKSPVMSVPFRPQTNGSELVKSDTKLPAFIKRTID